MNSEVCLHLVKERSGILLPGEVSERHFWLLIEISGMHSEKVINALREHLVMGYNLANGLKVGSGTGDDPFVVGTTSRLTAKIFGDQTLVPGVYRTTFELTTWTD
ncbi:TPA: PapB/FocB family fimbrial expression transcriptional regulator [Escherichia coli]